VVLRPDWETVLKFYYCIKTIMIEKKIFFTGSVFRFYVPEIGKYAFCKYYDFTYLNKFHGLLAQVFDYFSDVELNSVDDLKSADWLFGHRSMHRWPNLRKDSGWKYLGLLSAPSDDFVPDFKGVQAVPWVVEDESKIGPWYSVTNLSKRGPNCEYMQVRHLEMKILTVASLSLAWRTGMEYCRINGLPVEDYYDLNAESKRLMYFQMINVPFYKDLPKEIRGRALTDI
jgi:hypothetical protein